MKIALIGATGFVGTALLKEALERGHQVTAVVRHPEKLPRHANLTGRATDARDPAQVKAAVAGQDAVISAYNPGWKDPTSTSSTCAPRARSSRAQGKRGSSA
jgi:putative NADH-flavin reductase